MKPQHSSPVFKCLPALAAGASLAFLAAAPHASADEAVTDPVGAVSFSIAAGSVGNAVPTLISVPLIGQIAPSYTGISSGVVSAFDSETNTISVASGGWTTGQLSTAAAPHYVFMESGPAAGRYFLISSNTANTLTVNTQGLLPNPPTVGDRFSIMQGETLLSLFGTPADGIIGGSAGNIGTVDVVRLYSGGWKQYYYNTTNSRWEQVGLGFLGSQNNVAIRPDSGAIIFRVGPKIDFQVTGKVHTIPVNIIQSDNNPAINSNLYGVPITINNIGLNNTQNWKAVGDSGINSHSDADKLRINLGYGWIDLYYNRTSSAWYRPGLEFLGSQNNLQLPPGTAYIVFRTGSNQSFEHIVTKPYTLN